MRSWPEDEPSNLENLPESDPGEPAAAEPPASSRPEPWPGVPSGAALPSAEGDGVYAPSEPQPDTNLEPASPPPLLLPESSGPVEPPRFEMYEAPHPPERIPNFGHFAILCLLVLFGLLFTGLLMQLALRRHLFGIPNVQKAMTDIHYALGSEAILYLFTLGECLLVFPMVWHKSFFAGIQWNGGTALLLRWRLVSAAFACFLLALLNGVLIPGPTNAPIDKIFRAPGAAWFLFAFGITFAPFFEETLFRGFLLPALCTAFDWFGEKTMHQPRRPLAENGHPQWSMAAMITATVLTSIPFALLHAEQTGWAIGPFFLLIGVSIVLCAIRLSARSLASSVLVHASYNFMLFFIMLVGTHGFRHLEKM
jgi:membrane protease YdiL (CAAX protease family)